jgi:hypothetical protein
VENVTGVGAERGDGGYADHHDQGQHDRVLDRRRAVFTLHEIQGELDEPTHVFLSFLVLGKTRFPPRRPVSTVPVKASN